jgi:hypothetical protein
MPALAIYKRISAAAGLSLAGLVVLVFGGRAQTQAPTIPPALGWYQIPNTALQSVCAPASRYPQIQGTMGCNAVISAWNGGAADIKRNRLMVWGGGHSDYFGNEVYALDLNTLSMLRLTEPSPVSNVGTCPEAYPDGAPSSRHTYDGLVYLPVQDKLFSYGGSKSGCGFMSVGSWALDLATLHWKSLDPHGGATPGGLPGVMADFDPNTGLVFLFDTENFYTYNPANNSYARIAQQGGPRYNLTGVIDPGRKLFFMVGGGTFYAYSISHSYKLENWTSRITGCEAIVRVSSPGLAYDPVQKLIVGWAGGNTVYVFDPDTRACTPASFPQGPGAPSQWGTFGRWRYFPTLGVFALVNDWRQNAWTLRLRTQPVPEAPAN